MSTVSFVMKLTGDFEVLAGSVAPGKTAPPAVDVAFHPAHVELVRTVLGAVPKEEVAWAPDVWVAVPLKADKVLVRV